MSAGTMGRLSIGVTGLQTNQYALNTTAHNLTNTQTQGYSRQQVMLTDRTYNNLGSNAIRENQAGLGVVTAEIKTIRDNFADQGYRTETGREKYYKAQSEAVAELENYFGELEGRDFNSTLNSLWLSLQELQKESNSIVTRSSFIATAQTFLDRANSVRSSLILYQRNLNGAIDDQTNRINEIGKEILELNEKILSAEGSGIEKANDYRDARNLLYDELSGLVSTEIIVNDDNTAEIYIENRIFVTKGRMYELETVNICDNEQYLNKYPFAQNATDFKMPVWKDDQTALFNIDRIPKPDNDSDVGSLQGLLMSRGYFVSDYTDVPVRPTKPAAEDYTDPALYNADMLQYEQDCKTYAEKQEFFNTYIEPYTVTNLMCQFDVLINGIMEGINDTLCPNKEVLLADGTTVVKVLDEEAAGIGMGRSNGIAGTELFVRKSVPRYTEQTLTLNDGTTATFMVYNEQSDSDYYSRYAVGNVEVNKDLQQNPSLLPLTRESGEEAQEVVDKMLALWDKKFSTVGPNSLVECNFMDYYAGMIDDLADRGYTYTNMQETASGSANELNNLRQEVVGVSSDEELSNLIRFQHAYNASSRYINVVSEMIEYLIQTLGA